MTGKRKLTAWGWIFGFAVGFTFSLIWSQYAGKLPPGTVIADIPENVGKIIVWCTGFFFGANVIGDHGKEALKSLAEVATALADARKAGK